jgi:aminoglycoside phosphotransferase (APT) family kinase protein
MTSLLQLPQHERAQALHPLLAQLQQAGEEAEDAWRGCLRPAAVGRGCLRSAAFWRDWRIRRIDGGWSNLLYRATSEAADLAVKFTLRDGRDRAGREYGALAALGEAGRSVAPEPLLLDRTRYAQPVVVQTWLGGEVSSEPPTGDSGWSRLVEHFAGVHAVRPDHTMVQLPEAVINANDPAQALDAVQRQVARIPFSQRPASLANLLQQLKQCCFPSWPEPPAALCRIDNNILNMVRRPGPWASVDWENAGWGDPAFDVAHWITHASYIGVPPARWQWVKERYVSAVDDPTVAQRIDAYLPIVWVWWVVRLARYLYEIPRGLDDRLVPWPDGWQADLQAKYEHYLAKAESALVAVRG